MALKMLIGYCYEQRYSFEDKQTGEHKEGYTPHCVVHQLDDAEDIVKTFDYKISPQFADECFKQNGKVVGGPMFDGFMRLAGFFKR